MPYKNSGSDEHEILQNQFTSFLSFAVSNARIDYLRVRIKRLQRELTSEQYEIIIMQDGVDLDALAENDALCQAIRNIKDRERQVFLARVLDEKRFKTIAEELGIGEKGVAAIYYRTVKKLRDMLEGGE